MTGLTSREVSNFVFVKAEENNNFEHYTDDSDDEFSFVELKDKIAEALALSDVSPKNLQHEKHGPDNIKS